LANKADTLENNMPVLASVRRDLAGGSPAASYLFCFAKKGNPKKATARRCPTGSHESSAPVGKRMQLATLKHHALLYPTGTLLSWQRLKRNF